ncbi:hypothetical protein KKH43_04175 [Patescibacteria group bacterium]|nr:hypothetical protein [Patescibacteria group bacterium]
MRGEQEKIAYIESQAESDPAILEFLERLDADELKEYDDRKWMGQHEELRNGVREMCSLPVNEETWGKIVSKLHEIDFLGALSSPEVVRNPAVDKQDLMHRLIEKQSPWIDEMFESCRDQLTNLDEIFDYFWKYGHYYMILGHLEDFEQYVSDHQRLVDRALKHGVTGNWEAVIENLDKLKGVDKEEVFDEAYERLWVYAEKNKDQKEFNELYAIVGENIHKLPEIGSDRADEVIAGLINMDRLDLAERVNQKTGIPDKLLHEVSKKYKGRVDLRLFVLAQQIYEEEPAEDFRALGVQETGEKGLQELIEVYQRERSRIISGDFSLEDFQNSVFDTMFKSIVRFGYAEYGDQNEAVFRAKVELYYSNESQYVSLNEAYVASEPVRVFRYDGKAQDEFQFPEPVQHRLNVLLHSIEEARRFAGQDEGANLLLERIREKRSKAVLELAERIESQENEKAKIAFSDLQANLEALDLEELKNPQEMFVTLRKSNFFEEELRQAMFYFAFLNHPNFLEKRVGEFNRENSSIDELSWVHNFTGHVALQATLLPYFKNNKARKELKSLLNTSALKQGISQYSNLPTKGSKSMRFDPHRDLLTEFSGYIADACWTEGDVDDEENIFEGEVVSILDEFPNVVSENFVINPDTENEKFGGATLLIETESKDNEKLLVITGINPLENVINQLSPRDFLKQYLIHLDKAAKRLERKTAITIDDHSGGSATNRPTFFAYLSKIKPYLKKVTLKSKEDTEFNGYDIREDTYLISVEDLERIEKELNL